MTVITQKELANHNKKACVDGGAGQWIIIHGKVYDTSLMVAKSVPCEFLKMTEHAGRDATKAFELTNHSDLAKEMMENCFVGQYEEVR